MMEPAKTVIEICGGIDAVAKICARDRSRVTRWGYPKERGGSDGMIPTPVANRLLEFAREEKLPLRAEHFFLATLARDTQ